MAMNFPVTQAQLEEHLERHGFITNATLEEHLTQASYVSNFKMREFIAGELKNEHDALEARFTQSVAPLAPSDCWNPGGALSAAPVAEIPQGARSKLPVVETGPESGAKWVTGELEPAVNVEGGVRTPLAPSEM